jgi:hypothetical protein
VDAPALWGAVVLWVSDDAPQRDIHRVEGCLHEGEAMSLAWAWVSTLHNGLAKAVVKRRIGNVNWNDITSGQIAHFARLGGA